LGDLAVSIVTAGRSSGLPTPGHSTALSRAGGNEQGTKDGIAKRLIDEEAMATLIRIADGRFRRLYRLLQKISRVLEINMLDKTIRVVVEAAREGLFIGTG
jgi:hypothetical protein